MSIFVITDKQKYRCINITSIFIYDFMVVLNRKKVEIIGENALNPQKFMRQTLLSKVDIVFVVQF